MEKKYSLWNPPPQSEWEDILGLPEIRQEDIEFLENMRDNLIQSLGISEELLKWRTPVTAEVMLEMTD